MDNPNILIFDFTRSKN